MNGSDINSPVFLYKQKTGLKPEFKELSNFLDKEIASIKEGEFLEKYKIEGWNILNKAKTGGLGGTYVKWTLEKCLNEAKKYNSIKEWRKNSMNSYLAVIRNNEFKAKIYNHLNY